MEEAKRILVCGLNGAGKSTFGRALAAELGIAFFDIEDFYFPGREEGAPYVSSLSREEVTARLLTALRDCGAFVLASVTADYGGEAEACLDLAVFLHVPDELRARRVRDRSYAKFGARMLPGGDLYEQEEGFFAMTANRTEERVTAWLERTGIPVVHLDGTQPAEENVRRFLAGEAKQSLEYKGFVGSVEYSASDGCYYGKVLGVRALISYEGMNTEELEKDFRRAVEDYLALCEAESRA